MALNKEQILNNVISGIDSIPKPREGKTVIAHMSYTNEIREAFKYARQVQNAYLLKDMRELYEVFNEYIKDVLSDCG